MTKADVVERLRQAIRPYASLKDAGSALQIAPSYIADVLKGRRDPGPSVLKALGLERKTLYAKSHD